MRLRTLRLGGFDGLGYATFSVLDIKSFQVGNGGEVPPLRSG